MMRWLRLGSIALIAFLAISYGLDWCWFKFSGSPRSKYTVHHFISAPMKVKNQQEIDYTGSEEVPCSLTLYPQDGFPPCWYLRGHTNQVSTY